MIPTEVTTVGVVLSVRAQPGARKNAITGEHDGALKVAVTAAPDKGKANEAIVAVLAKSFGLPKSAVELVSGPASRQKKFLLRGITESATHQVLQELLTRD